jgi:TusA-related sulfurtransferase
MSTITIDVRGLACPEPLLAFTDAAKKAEATAIDISFDCAAARDNITRAARSLGWRVASVEEAADYTIMHLDKAS